MKKPESQDSAPEQIIQSTEAPLVDRDETAKKVQEATEQEPSVIRRTFELEEFPERDEWGPRKSMVQKGTFSWYSQEFKYVNHARVLDALRESHFPFDMQLAFAAAASETFRNTKNAHFVTDVIYQENSDEITIYYDINPVDGENGGQFTFTGELIAKYHIPTLLGYIDPSEYEDDMKADSKGTLERMTFEPKSKTNIKSVFIFNAKNFLFNKAIVDRKKGVKYAFYSNDKEGLSQNDVELFQAAEAMNVLMLEINDLIEKLNQLEEELCFAIYCSKDCSKRKMKKMIKKYYYGVTHADIIIMKRDLGSSIDEYYHLCNKLIRRLRVINQEKDEDFDHSDEDSSFLKAELIKFIVKVKEDMQKAKEIYHKFHPKLPSFGKRDKQ